MKGEIATKNTRSGGGESQSDAEKGCRVGGERKRTEQTDWSLNLNGDGLIRLPQVDTKANYLDGFWQWVELLAANDYQGALEALYWTKKRTSWTLDALENRITTFWGGDAPWSVVVPNDRLVGVINDAAEFQPQNEEGWGWFLAQVPVTTEPADPKNDEIPLMGVASSFFVRQQEQDYVMEHEIFHL